MRVRLNKTAEKRYNRLNEPLLNRVTEAINKLEKEPPEGDIEPISGKPGNFRLRIGDIRILFQDRKDVILITDIVSRGQAYDKKHIGRK
jgi:mRNA interferase RelE/StbE